MPTIEEALQALGIDYTDAAVTANVTRKLQAANKRLLRAVGYDVWELLPDDPEAKELLFAYLEEAYNEQGVISAKTSNARRAMVMDAELQLRLELARIRSGAAVEGDPDARIITDSTGQEIVAAILSVRDAIDPPEEEGSA